MLPVRPALLALALLLAASVLTAEPIPVRHSQGTYHGFLLLRSDTGQQLAVGDLVQVAHGDRVTSRLTFRFHDGSLDDETAIFTQRGVFRLLRDRHIQRGPSFPTPLDAEIDATAGQIITRSTGNDGKPSIATEHMDLPPDLYNGLTMTVLTNLDPKAPETRISMLAPTAKPRLIHLRITPDGPDPLRIGPSRRQATRFRVHYDLGGITGKIAPLIGKQPEDILVSILGGEAPSFVRFSGQLYEGGPMWHIVLVSPTFPASQ